MTRADSAVCTYIAVWQDSSMAETTFVVVFEIVPDERTI